MILRLAKEVARAAEDTWRPISCPDLASGQVEKGTMTFRVAEALGSRDSGDWQDMKAETVGPMVAAASWVNPHSGTTHLPRRLKFGLRFP